MTFFSMSQKHIFHWKFQNHIRILTEPLYLLPTSLYRPTIDEGEITQPPKTKDFQSETNRFLYKRPNNWYWLIRHWISTPNFALLCRGKVEPIALIFIYTVGIKLNVLKCILKCILNVLKCIKQYIYIFFLKHIEIQFLGKISLFMRNRSSCSVLKCSEDNKYVNNLLQMQV